MVSLPGLLPLGFLLFESQGNPPNHDFEHKGNFKTLAKMLWWPKISLNLYIEKTHPKKNPNTSQNVLFEMKVCMLVFKGAKQ